MEFVQVRFKTGQVEADYGGYYNYEFAIPIEKSTTQTDFNLPRDSRYKDDRIGYSIRNREFKIILKDKS